ncbi:hypothetical protein [Aquimarina agarivorans]|uniref:hypothetical protein n=1 Tax=Aquimarina agarivorans TaxID=980584 RepID=UPI000248E86E|nr:hypothetical protein [Aquimarina agarivorans]
MKVNTNHIHLLHVDTQTILFKDFEKPTKTNFKIDIGHHVQHNLKEGLIKIGLKIRINAEAHKNKGEAVFLIDSHFKIDEMNTYYSLNEDNKPKFEGLLIITLTSIAYSTARGVVLEKLSKTNLAGIVLPIVDPINLLGKPIAKQVQER